MADSIVVSLYEGVDCEYMTRERNQSAYELSINVITKLLYIVEADFTIKPATKWWKTRKSCEIRLREKTDRTALKENQSYVVSPDEVWSGCSRYGEPCLVFPIFLPLFYCLHPPLMMQTSAENQQVSIRTFLSSFLIFHHTFWKAHNHPQTQMHIQIWHTAGHKQIYWYDGSLLQSNSILFCSFDVINNWSKVSK